MVGLTDTSCSKCGKGNAQNFKRVGGLWQQTFTSNDVVLFASKAVPSLPKQTTKDNATQLFF